MQLTMRLVGREIKEVRSNGHLLALRLDDNTEVVIAWVDDNGKAIKGRPVVHSSGGRIDTRSLHELIKIPH